MNTMNSLFLSDTDRVRVNRQTPDIYVLSMESTVPDGYDGVIATGPSFTVFATRDQLINMVKTITAGLTSYAAADVQAALTEQEAQP